MLIDILNQTWFNLIIMDQQALSNTFMRSFHEIQANSSEVANVQVSSKTTNVIEKAGQCGNQMGTKFWQLVSSLLRFCTQQWNFSVLTSNCITYNIINWCSYTFSSMSSWSSWSSSWWSRWQRSMGWTGLELTVAIQNCSWNALRLGDFKTLYFETWRLWNS